MEDVFSLKYGMGGACALLALIVMMKAGEFILSFQKKKESLSEQTIQELTRAVKDNTSATQHLDRRLEKLEGAASEIPKFRTDIRRVYTALKYVAGSDWPRIRDEIMKDDLTQ